MSKQLFHGLFNWYGEQYDLYCYASSENIAYFIFILQLKKRLNRLARTIDMYFRNTNRYSIKAKQQILDFVEGDTNVNN